MNDFHRSYEDGQLPWLQAVEDEDEPSGISARKMFVVMMVVIAAALIVGATFFWLGRRQSAVTGPPQIIKSLGPYKVKPDDPGGLDFAGDSQTAFETSAGQDPDAQLDMSKLKETGTTAPPPQPVAPAAAGTAGTEAKPVPKPEPKPATPPAPSGAAGTVVQLGAFANRAQAERAWTSLSARFPSVAAMGKMIVPFPGGIRLRAGAATPADARAACQTLKAAGENCFVAQ